MDSLTLVDKPISQAELKKIAEQRFGDLVKGVVDIEKGVMVLGGELHADEEAWLLQHGSKQTNLWGINLYPNLAMPDRLEFDSMINIRPSQNNTSRDVEDEAIRARIVEIIGVLISEADGA